MGKEEEFVRDKEKGDGNREWEKDRIGGVWPQLPLLDPPECLVT